MPKGRSKATWQRAVVGNEAGHVDVLLVDAQVLHAAHKLTVADGEILREFGDSSEEQRPGQVQGSGKHREYFYWFWFTLWQYVT